jgi:hypothetical protein
MLPFATGAALKTALALTAVTSSAVMFAGTAEAATPAASSTTAATPVSAGIPRADPHRRGFRNHFKSQQQCIAFANHDRNPRTNGWDCRHGGNRDFPWEYWY